MDLVLLNPTTNQYSVSIMGAARYVANKTTLQPPSISGKQGPLLLVGLADLDDNGSTDRYNKSNIPSLIHKLSFSVVSGRIWSQMLHNSFYVPCGQRQLPVNPRPCLCKEARQ